MTTEKQTKKLKYGKPKKVTRVRKAPTIVSAEEEESQVPPEKQPSVQIKKEEDPMAKYELLPHFAKPYRSYKDGKWIVRPNKAPKSMMDILMDSVNLEFFKRYMQFNGKDMPLLLWEAVEQLKHIKDAKTRHQHISYTLKKFFQNRNSKYRSK